MKYQGAYYGTQKTSLFTACDHKSNDCIEKQHTEKKTKYQGLIMAIRIGRSLYSHACGHFDVDMLKFISGGGVRRYCLRQPGKSMKCAPPQLQKQHCKHLYLAHALPKKKNRFVIVMPYLKCAVMH